MCEDRYLYLVILENVVCIGNFAKEYVFVHWHEVYEELWKGVLVCVVCMR